MISELSRQLDSWRALLPRPLRWLENDRFHHPGDETTSQHLPNLFSDDNGATPISYKCNLDVLTAQLRSCFYHARYMLYRPFVYKVLHFPELVTTNDASCCVLAVQAACLWPVFMAPSKDKKRLVPHLLTWTHNSVGILLMFRMMSYNQTLRKICDGRVSGQELDRTATLVLDWLRDLRQIDAAAQWACTILEPIFAGGKAVE